MADLEVKYSSQDKPLTADDLAKKAWWRFAQVVFVLAAAFLFGATTLFAVSGLVSANTINRDSSVFTCENGHGYNLDSFLTDSGIYYLGSASIGEDGLFTYPEYSARAKMFCAYMGRGEEFDRLDFITYYSGDNKDQIDAAWETPAGDDMRYSVNVVRDYSQYAIIGVGFLIAIAVEAGLLYAVRGIARYTLIGKFF